MRSTIHLTAALALCSWSIQATAQAPAQAAPAAAPAAPKAPAAAPAAKPFQLNETTWTFTDTDGTKVQESIDAKGNFIANSADGKKHLDHGTSVMKGDKACFTSAMTKEGEVCWTTKAVEIGQSMDTVSDKGRKLTVSRIAYTPMTIPK